MKNKIVKIGIIGPRCFSLGGHDVNNLNRVQLRKDIGCIIMHEQKKGNTVLGLTGLDIGTEQDFASVCCERNIDYYHYIAYSNVDYIWDDIEYAKRTYDALSERALSTIVLNDGDYSPKKINAKNKRIISDADILIYVSNPMLTDESNAIKIAKELKKDIRILTIQANQDVS